MPKINIKKSIVINKSASEVFAKLNDFNEWKVWSPWLVMEPKALVNVREDKKYYDWKGDIVGSGNMSITNEVVNKSIDSDLTFLTPFKSKAKVGFVLEELADGTKVSWTMESSLPFFLFWMKKKMEVFIGMDYDRGLQMLKDYVEDGKVHSDLVFKPNQELKGGKYIAIKTDCTMDTISSYMENDYSKLMTYVMENHQDKLDGYAFSIYHKFDPVKGGVSYSACVPLNEIPSDLPEGVTVGEKPTLKTYAVNHKGSYRHISNAWTAQMMYSRAKVYKMDRKHHPMEVYLNSPKNTPENDLETEVHFVVK